MSRREPDPTALLAPLGFSVLALGMLYVTFFKEGAGIAERLLCGMVFLVLVAGVVLAVLGRGKKVAGVAARAGEPFRFEFKTLKGLHSLWLDYVWSGPGEELAG